MKIFSKNWFRNNRILLLLLLLALALRFYNFGDRAVFWTEQARSLITSAGYSENPTLLGQEYFRQDSFGRKIFSGAVFNYSLVPLILISRGDPLLITAFFALLNVGTGIVVYIVALKMYGKKEALIASAFFLFNDYMIYHSLFIWNYNYLPLVGVLIYYFLIQNFRKQSLKNLFLIAFLSGIGFSLQILFAVIALIIFLAIWIKTGITFKKFLIYLSGAALGNLPMVLFDLRHDFYHTRTLVQFLVDTFSGSSDAGISYYYFLPFWPIACLMAGVLMVRHLKAKVIRSALILYLVFNMTSPRIDFKNPIGVPGNLKVGELETVSEFISADSGTNYNVASTLDFDKRAYYLRYYLNYIYKDHPRDEVTYSGIDRLYVVAPKEYNFAESGIWEINAGGPYKISGIKKINDKISVFRLTK